MRLRVVGKETNRTAPWDHGVETPKDFISS
jgi:hypothetical protein